MAAKQALKVGFVAKRKNLFAFRLESFVNLFYNSHVFFDTLYVFSNTDYDTVGYPHVSLILGFLSLNLTSIHLTRADTRNIP